MDNDDFAEIIALCEDETPRIPLEEQLASYDKRDGRTLLKLWKRFSAIVPSLRGVEPFSTRPTLSQVKAFFLWRCKTAQGRIDPMINTNTLSKELNRLDRIVALAVGHGYNRSEKAEVKKFIKKELPRLGHASTKQREKPVALYADVEELLYFLWCCDEYNWIHPRVQIHISFFLILECFYGLRPGEIIESTSEPGSNTGITHGDIRLSLARKDGKPRYQLRIHLRFRKHRKGKEGESMYINLYEELDSTKRFTCPVVHYLALALADNVFLEQRSPADFAKRYIPSSTNSRSFPIREDKKTLPVIRKLEGSNFSDSRIMTGGSLNTYLTELGERAGYRDRITGYAFRRGFANGIEDQTSAQKLRQLLGHANDGTYQSYITSTIGIDTQNAVRGIPQDKESVNFARSVAFTRDINGPKPTGSALSISYFVSSDEVASMAAKYPNSPRRSLISKILAERNRQARAEYFAIPHQDENEDKEINDKVVQRIQPKPSKYFNLMLKYDTTLKSIITNFWPKGIVPFEKTIEPLWHRAVPTTFRLQYPQTKPLQDGHCPYCQRSVAHEALHLRQFHVLQCASKFSGNYCFSCAGFLDTDRRYCGVHTIPDPFCGLLIRYGLLLKPGECVFCPNKFFRWTELRNHLEMHISSMSEQGVLICPFHPLDGSYTSGDKFRTHLSEAHGVNWTVHGGSRSRF